MSEPTAWTKSFDYLKPKEVRVGQVSPRRAAATYKQIEEQQKLNDERYSLPSWFYENYRGENI